jgi:hypothetical protein
MLRNTKILTKKVIFSFGLGGLNKQSYNLNTTVECAFQLN